MENIIFLNRRLYMMIDKGNYKLYKGDCLEIMKQIPDESIDMILCDLPY